MPPTATAPPRSQIDDAAVEAELAKERGETEDDGLGPEPGPEITDEEFNDPNSEYNTGVPGGRKAGDDGYVEPDSAEPPAGQQPPPPPTPPANLPDEEPEDDPEAEAEVPPLGIVGNRELGLKVGGRKPDSSTLHLKGGKIELTGPKGSQFDRGDRFLTVSTLQVTGDNDQDTIVKHTGEITSASKKQSATLCGIERIEEWLLGRLVEAKIDDDEVDHIFAVLGVERPE